MISKISPSPMKGKLRNLTISMVLMFVLIPFLENDVVGVMILNILLTAILFFGIIAVSYERKNLIIAVAFGLPWLMLTWMELFMPIPLLLILVSNILMILFLAFTAFVILRFILKSAQVNEDVLYGAVSLYLLIGGIWAIIYILIEIVQPGSFFIDPAHNIDGVVNWSDFFYYSFITLTTVGYGDIIPVSSHARYFAVIEAIMGVMYLAMLISRLVGMYIVQSKNE